MTDKSDPAAELVFTDPPFGISYGGGRARRQADVIFTDPPYGMGFGTGRQAGSTLKGATVKAHGQILGDDLKGEALVDLVAGALARARAAAAPGAAVYVCLAESLASTKHQPSVTGTPSKILMFHLTTLKESAALPPPAS